MTRPIPDLPKLMQDGRRSVVCRHLNHLQYAGTFTNKSKNRVFTKLLPQCCCQKLSTVTIYFLCFLHSLNTTVHVPLLLAVQPHTASHAKVRTLIGGPLCFALVIGAAGLLLIPVSLLVCRQTWAAGLLLSPRGLLACLQTWAAGSGPRCRRLSHLAA